MICCRRIELEAQRNSKTLAQGPRDKAASRGRADERKRRQIDPYRPRRRALADDEVELEILHRRVKDFLNRRSQPVNLVDEQNVMWLQVGQQRRQIARARNHRPGRGAKPDSQLARDDLRQRGLAEPRRA